MAALSPKPTSRRRICPAPSLKHADVRRAHFFKASLRGANLTDALTAGADFTDADLSGATWTDGHRVCAEGSLGDCN